MPFHPYHGPYPVVVQIGLVYVKTESASGSSGSTAAINESNSLATINNISKVVAEADGNCGYELEIGIRTFVIDTKSKSQKGAFDIKRDFGEVIPEVLNMEAEERGETVREVHPLRCIHPKIIPTLDIPPNSNKRKTAILFCNQVKEQMGELIRMTPRVSNIASILETERELELVKTEGNRSLYKVSWSKEFEEKAEDFGRICLDADGLNLPSTAAESFDKFKTQIFFCDGYNESEYDDNPIPCSAGRKPLLDLDQGGMFCSFYRKGYIIFPKKFYQDQDMVDKACHHYKVKEFTSELVQITFNSNSSKFPPYAKSASLVTAVPLTESEKYLKRTMPSSTLPFLRSQVKSKQKADMGLYVQSDGNSVNANHDPSSSSTSEFITLQDILVQTNRQRPTHELNSLYNWLRVNEGKKFPKRFENQPLIPGSQKKWLWRSSANLSSIYTFIKQKYAENGVADNSKNTSTSNQNPNHKRPSGDDSDDNMGFEPANQKKKL